MRFDIRMVLGWQSLWVIVVLVIAVMPLCLWRSWRLAYSSCWCLMWLALVTILWLAESDRYNSMALSFARLVGTDLKGESIGVSSNCGAISLSANMYVSHDRDPSKPQDSAMFAWSRSSSIPVKFREYPNFTSQAEAKKSAFWVQRGGFEVLMFTTPDTPHRGATLLWGGIILPNWVLMLGLSVLPSYWIFGRKVRQRKYARAHGVCEGCLFDLRGTPPQPDGTFRCGECGHINRSMTPVRQAEEIVRAVNTKPPASTEVND